MPKLKKILPIIILTSRAFIITLSLNVYCQATTTEGYRVSLKPNPSNERIETKADPTLQNDITKRLFFEASKYHKRCNHRILKAEGYLDIERSIIISNMDGKAIELEQKLRAKEQIWLERWFIKSCAAIDIYEVLLIKSGEGTDILVIKIEYEGNKK